MGGGADDCEIRFRVTQQFHPAVSHLSAAQRANGRGGHLSGHLPGILRGRFPPEVLTIQASEGRKPGQS